MSPSNQDVSYDVVCPCCGHDGAKIAKVKDIQGEGPDRILATHLDCGYQEKVDTYICQLFGNYHFILGEKSIVGETSKTVTIRSRYEEINKDWGKVKKIVSKMGSFPITVHLQAVNSFHTICPICNKTEFTRNKDFVFCNNDGYCLEAHEYFELFLEEHKYESYEHQNEGENNKENKERYFQIFCDGLYVANIILRSNSLDDKVIIVHQTINEKDHYQKFIETLKQLNIGFPEESNKRFRIIIRKEEEL